jgi:hypothetical protein
MYLKIVISELLIMLILISWTDIDRTLSRRAIFTTRHLCLSHELRVGAMTPLPRVSDLPRLNSNILPDKSAKKLRLYHIN